MYSPSHLQAGTPMLSIQKTLCTAPDLRKNVSLPVLFRNNGKSYTVSKQSDIYIYIYVHIHILHSIERLVEHKPNKILGQQ